jgi:hypothetical protein
MKVLLSAVRNTPFSVVTKRGGGIPGLGCLTAALRKRDRISGIGPRSDWLCIGGTTRGDDDNDDDASSPSRQASSTAAGKASGLTLKKTSGHPPWRLRSAADSSARNTRCCGSFALGDLEEALVMGASWREW